MGGIESIIIPGAKFDRFARDLTAFFPNNPSIEDCVDFHTYLSGEDAPKITTDVKDRRVYIASSPRSPRSTEIDIQHMYFNLLQLADAAKHAGATEVTLLAADLLFSREHRDPSDPQNENKCKGLAFTADLLARLFHAAGVDRVVTLDVHSQDLFGFYRKAYGEDGHLISLDPSPIHAHIMTQALADIGASPEKVYLIGLDKGAQLRVERLQRYLGMDVECLYFHKKREQPNEPQSITTEMYLATHSGDPKKVNLDGAIVIVPDDIGDTYGTVFKNLSRLREYTTKNGEGIKYLFACLTHQILTRNADRVIDATKMNVIASMSHPTLMEKTQFSRLQNLKWYNPAAYFAQTIHLLERGINPVEVFNPENTPLNACNSLYGMQKGEWFKYNNRVRAEDLV